MAAESGMNRIVEIFLGVAVDAAAIGVDARRQKQALADGEEFFLSENAVILDTLALLEDTDVGAGTDDPHLRGTIEPLLDLRHPLGFGIPVAQARPVEEVLELGE